MKTTGWDLITVKILILLACAVCASGCRGNSDAPKEEKITIRVEQPYSQPGQQKAEVPQSPVKAAEPQPAKTAAVPQPQKKAAAPAAPETVPVQPQKPSPAPAAVPAPAQEVKAAPVQKKSVTASELKERIMKERALLKDRGYLPKDNDRLFDIFQGAKVRLANGELPELEKELDEAHGIIVALKTDRNFINNKMNWISSSLSETRNKKLRAKLENRYQDADAAAKSGNYDKANRILTEIFEDLLEARKKYFEERGKN